MYDGFYVTSGPDISIINKCIILPYLYVVTAEEEIRAEHGQSNRRCRSRAEHGETHCGNHATTWCQSAQRRAVPRRGLVVLNT